jgi:hypothetical protein
MIAITTSLNVGDEVVEISANITNKLIVKLFAVCKAELTSIPFIFQMKNPFGKIFIVFYHTTISY